MKKQILLLYELHSDQIEELTETAKDYELIYSLDEVDIENLEIVLGWSDDLTAIIEDDKSIIKWIQYPYAGVNNLPLDLFEQKEILLTNGSGIHQYAVAESTIGLILGMTRNIVPAAKNQDRAKWVNVNNLYELYGKTMMIVGAGKIGVHLGQIAKGFGMTTIGINRSGREIQNMDEQYTQKELDKVIDKADIVVNILPATSETHHLFDQELFSKMKDNVIFVNVGRGETVDTDALLTALDNEKVLFAGLDVFEEEPLPSDHPLWSHEKVLITPHIAGRVEDYPKHLYPLFYNNFVAFINNDTLPENLVEFEYGY